MRHGRRVDPRAFKPVYLQLAEILHEQITSGVLAEGDLLPSEPHLAQEYEIGLLTVRKALRVLRAERLVVTERGIGNRVRRIEEPTIVDAQPGDAFLVRPATPDEQYELGLPGDPVLDIERRDGSREVLPAYDRKVNVRAEAADDGEGGTPRHDGI